MLNGSGLVSSRTRAVREREVSGVGKRGHARTEWSLRSIRLKKCQCMHGFFRNCWLLCLNSCSLVRDPALCDLHGFSVRFLRECNENGDENILPNISTECHGTNLNAAAHCKGLRRNFPGGSVEPGGRRVAFFWILPAL